MCVHVREPRREGGREEGQDDYLITPNLKPVSESGPFVYTQFGPNRIWICRSMKLLPGADSMDSRWCQLVGNVCLLLILFIM